jgi:hypothetical protein
MRYSLLLPLSLLGLAGCIVETPPRTTTTYVTPAPTTTYVSPTPTVTYPTATYVAPATPTTVYHTPY